MRLSMLRLLMIVIIFVANLSALSIEQKIVNFEKRRVSMNPTIELIDVNVYHKQHIKDSWNGYIVKLKLKLLRQNNKIIEFRDVLFSDGSVLTPELFDVKNYKDYKKFVRPNLSPKYYDKQHLIAGDLNAKHKVVIFSDPICPFCIESLPKTIKEIQNSKNIALFYYHYPLYRIHPPADTVTRYMVVNHNKDLVLKIYQAKLDEKLGFTSDAKKILDTLNKLFHTNTTLKDIQQDWVSKDIHHDIQMGEDVMVNGTPTYFFDGKYDLTREEYKKYLN